MATPINSKAMPAVGTALDPLRHRVFRALQIATVVSKHRHLALTANGDVLAGPVRQPH